MCRTGNNVEVQLRCAPWWGGFWERLVGMVKSCLKKSIGREKLSFTELLTVLLEVENILNNHPLCFVYDDVRRFNAKLFALWQKLRP